MSCNSLVLTSDKTEVIIFRHRNLSDMLSSQIAAPDDFALASEATVRKSSLTKI